MELDFGLLTDKADPSPGGTLHLWGAGFEGLNTSTFPATHQFSVVVKMLASKDDLARGHRVSLEVIDPDGERKQLMSNSDVRLQPAKNPDRPLYAIFILGLAYSFTNPGKYTFKFLVDGRELKSWPIWLDQADGKQLEAAE